MSETVSSQATSVLAETPFTTYFTVRQLGAARTVHQGGSTIRNVSGIQHEVDALLHRVGVYDLGYRRRVRVTGEDRLRWLNGMLTNSVLSLPEVHWNYSLLLNAQGRIQGDCEVYRAANEVILETDASQLVRLIAHLDRFIIMDDVVLEDSATNMTAVGLSGPGAEQLLERLKLPRPEEGQFTKSREFTVVRAYSIFAPSFKVWLPAEDINGFLDSAAEAGGVLCGLDASEILRVLQGIPLYGVDMLERHLPQETSQTRALNFNKGCYLGQEIVERIRSRATVHRGLRQFELMGTMPVPGTALNVSETAVGELSSVIRYKGKHFALGFMRNEAAERGERIVYEGGTAFVLNSPPDVAEYDF